MTSALASTLARDWILDVREPGTTEWIRVRGLSSVAPIFEGAEQDASDIDSNGYSSPIVTGLSYRIEGGGKRKGENTSGFVDDPGQNFLRRKGRKTGLDNYIEARIYRRDALPDAHQSTNIVKWTDSAASDPNALQEFSFTLGGVGEPQEITKPLVPSTEQTFTVTVGGASAGTFTLTWNGKTTAPIAYNAAASAVKTALVGLDDGYGTTDFDVTGSAGGPYTVKVPGGVLTGDGTGLTGGAFAVAAA